MRRHLPNKKEAVVIKRYVEEGKTFEEVCDLVKEVQPAGVKQFYDCYTPDKTEESSQPTEPTPPEPED